MVSQTSARAHPAQAARPREREEPRGSMGEPRRLSGAANVLEIAAVPKTARRANSPAEGRWRTALGGLGAVARGLQASRADVCHARMHATRTKQRRWTRTHARQQNAG